MERNTGALFEEIRKLLDAPACGDDAPELAELEHTLTSGYACALALEAERWRLERRLSEVAAALGDGSGKLGASEIGAIAKRLSAADGELTRLRGLLGPLRDRAGELRVAQ